MKPSIFAVLLLAGCASSVAEIEPAYVPATAYRDFSCEELKTEAQSVSIRAQEAARAQDKRRHGDNAKMAVGLIVFWPALLFIKGDGAQAGEIARLKGEMAAIEQASSQHHCGIKFDRG